MSIYQQSGHNIGHVLSILIGLVSLRPSGRKVWGLSSPYMGPGLNTIDIHFGIISKIDLKGRWCGLIWSYKLVCIRGLFQSLPFDLEDRKVIQYWKMHLWQILNLDIDVILTGPVVDGRAPNNTDSNVDSGPFTHPDLGCLLRLKKQICIYHSVFHCQKKRIDPFSQLP